MLRPVIQWWALHIIHGEYFCGMYNISNYGIGLVCLGYISFSARGVKDDILPVHCMYKTILYFSYPYNGVSYNSEMTFVFWNKAYVVCFIMKMASYQYGDSIIKILDRYIGILYTCKRRSLLYPPHNEVVGGVYWFHSVHPSRIPCLLCSAQSSGWIHFIFIHLIKQHQKVCHM